MAEPLFKPGDSFIVTIAEVYRSDGKPTVGLTKTADYVYRMKGNIPLMRERELKLLERAINESNA